MGGISRVVRWLLPSFGSLLVLSALVNALIVRADQLFSLDGDAFRHIRTGEAILERGALPVADYFTHTRPGVEYVPYEWLSQTLFALADQVWGLAGAAVLMALLYAAAVLGVYRSTQELGAPRLFGLIVGVLALLLQAIHLLPRPHMFTTLFAAVFMIVLLRYARTGRSWVLAPLPIVMLFWVNAHPGFPIGFVLLAAFIAAAIVESPEFADGRGAVRPLVIALGACAVASVVNPGGPGMWTHTTDLLGSDFLISVTQEFQPVDFHSPFGKLFFVALFAGPALWMTGRVRVSWLAAGLFLLFSASALHSARNVTLFTVIVLPFLAQWMGAVVRGGGARERRVLEKVRQWGRTDRKLKPGLSTVVAIGLIGAVLGPATGLYRPDPDRLPVAALTSMEEPGTAGPVFNQMAWGGYLLYATDDVPVFIDGMTNLYGEELAREYLAVLDGRPGWAKVLDEYDVQWTLTRPSASITQLLALDREWTRTYADSVAVIYRRTGAGGEEPGRPQRVLGTP